MNTFKDFRLYILKYSAILEGNLAMSVSALGMKTTPSRGEWLIIFIIGYLHKRRHCQFGFDTRRFIVGRVK